MKINFKKIAPVFAGAMLLGSTIGVSGALAADSVTYPTSFSNAVVVVGSTASAEDTTAANTISVDLGKLSSAKTVSGESVKIETGSSKLYLGKTLNTVRTTVIGSSDMPTLLAKKTYQSKDGVSYDYEQEVTLGPNLNYTQFADIDFNNKIPSLGITKASNSPILNYTVRFVKTVESTWDSNNRLDDLQDTDITLMGKSYRVLNAYNNSNVKLELMAGAVVDTLTESNKKTYTIGGKSYDVTVSQIASDGAAITINGQTTPKLAAGTTFKLSDGTQLGVRTLWYQTNKVSSVEFSLGAEKLTLENGSKLKLNDENVNDVTVYLGQGVSSDKRTLSYITLAWITNDKAFLTAEKELVFPGLKTLKLTTTGFTTPKQEEIKVTNSGDNTIQLQIPIKSGDASIPLLSGNTSTFTKIGGETYGSYLLTDQDTEILFNRSRDQYFVASWNSSTAAESYFLKVSAITKDSPSTGQNSTTIDDAVTGSIVCKEKKSGDQCTIGNVILNINNMSVDGSGQVNITAGSGVNFRTIYTAGGMRINLPLDNSTGLTSIDSGKGEINLTADTTFSLWLSEADKNGVLNAGKALNVTLGFASGKVEVKNIDGPTYIMSGTNKFDLGGSSSLSKYVAYIDSELGTKLTYDTKPDQNTLIIEYHGGESYGNVYVAASEAVASSVLVVKDTEIDSYKTSKDLVVVGGAAVNKVAADLLKLSFPTYGTDAAWQTATGVTEDKALIKLFSGSDSLTPGKVALLVAGYNAKDTQAAAKALTTDKKFGVLSTTTASTYTYQ